MIALELVKCGCGVIRNDEDAPAPVSLDWFSSRVEPERFELPRTCRGCGALYMLPKPTAPSSAAPATSGTT